MTIRVLQLKEVLQLLRLYGRFILIAAALGGLQFALRSPQDPFREQWAALSFALLVVPASLLVMHMAGQLMTREGVSTSVIKLCLFGLAGLPVIAILIHQLWGAVASAIILPAILLYFSKGKT